MEKSTTDTVNGNFSNTPYIGTLANDGVGLAPYHDFESKVPAELNAKIEELKAQIIDGTIKVESTQLAPGQLTLPDRTTKPPAPSAGGLRRVRANHGESPCLSRSPRPHDR